MKECISKSEQRPHIITEDKPEHSTLGSRFRHKFWYIRPTSWQHVTSVKLQQKLFVKFFKFDVILKQFRYSVPILKLEIVSNYVTFRGFGV